jgi:amino acid adenylation domain-containing protein
VVGGGEVLSYGDLDRRAGELAGRLARLGVGPEARVAIFLERSPDLVVAQLAVLKAGGAYVPLDPDTPRERLAVALADCRAAAVVTRAPLAGRLPPTPVGPSIVRLDLPAPGAGDGGRPASAAPATPAPESLAYVIYTSGSTGAPKGVALTHGGLANLVDWHLDAYRLTPADRTALVAGLGFDASVWEVWPTLAAGASLHLPDDATRVEPERLAAWLAAAGVTVSFLPTPLAERVLAGRWPAGSALRALLTGGDTLHLHPPPALPFTLVNHYGPTEATVVTTAGAVPPAAGAGGLPAIGRPIANTRVHVLDRRLAPAPPGAPGELWVGGDGLARGYLDRPAQTADRFRPDPLGPAGGRLYRTGDLARWRPDGRLDFLGRNDLQVKLRGFRVELGEVEAVLARHPGVREAAAAVVPDGAGEPCLVAYWAPATIGVAAGGADLPDGAGQAEEGGRGPADAALRAFLGERLPKYMVPAVFVRMAALPLTANGKLDRAALPAPDFAATSPGEAFRPPATAVEELVAEVWREVLGRDGLGLDAHFFDLGGHSLTAIRVVARLRDLLAEELPLAVIFDRPLLGDFAAWLETRLAPEAGQPAAAGAAR